MTCLDVTEHSEDVDRARGLNDVFNQRHTVGNPRKIPLLYSPVKSTEIIKVFIIFHISSFPSINRQRISTK